MTQLTLDPTSKDIPLTVEGRCPGRLSFKATNCTAYWFVDFVYAFGTGNVAIPYGPCTGTRLGLDRTVVHAGRNDTNGRGEVRLDRFVPPAACGRVYVQAIDAATCRTSNVVLIP